MPIYEFACTPCFERGVVSTWEMQFKMDDPKNTFCPACGAKGHQVILTAPMVINGDSRDKHRAADKMLTKALDEQGGLRVKPRQPMSLEEHMDTQGRGEEPPPTSTPDPFKPRWGNAADVLAGASAATAETRQQGMSTGNDVRQTLSKVIPSEMVVHKADADKGRVPQQNARKMN